MSETREAVCLGDWERPLCRNVITQTKQANGLWKPCFCAECDEAFEHREGL